MFTNLLTLCATISTIFYLQYSGWSFFQTQTQMQTMLIRQLLKGSHLILLNHIPDNCNDLKAAAGFFTEKCENCNICFQHRIF